MGPFTKNNQITVSSFTNVFLYIANITTAAANEVLPKLNNTDTLGR